MNKKLIIILVVVLAVGGFAVKKFVLPKKAVAKPRVTGTLYVLPKGFTINLAGGHYLTMTVALDLALGQSDGANKTDAGSTTPSGFGTLVQEPVIRAIITGDITDLPEKALLSTVGRNRVRKEILKGITQQTDTKVRNLYFTDLAIQ